MSSSKKQLLFTPGPLTTSVTVKAAMLRDYGSRDGGFISIVGDIRRRLLALADVAPPEYAAILLQGSGTFSVESVFASAVPRDGRVLVVVNGAYGRRIVQVCLTLGIAVESIEFAEDEAIDGAALREKAARIPGLSHLAVVHCETTTGILNPVAAVGAIAAELGLVYVVDAMSSFGAVPLDLRAANVDFLVSSANKCIQGVPGFGFVLARREVLEGARGCARSVSLDLLAQLEGLDGNGQFRFTPPTQVLAAFHQALLELEAEGGVAARQARYQRNHQVLVEGMRGLGFEEYLRPELQGYIITSFRYPDDPHWDFEEFYTALSNRGCVIYPGKVSNADCFRIGNIGHLFEEDMRFLLAAVREVLEEMGVRMKGA